MSTSAMAADTAHGITGVMADGGDLAYTVLRIVIRLIVAAAVAGMVAAAVGMGHMLPTGAEMETFMSTTSTITTTFIVQGVMW